MLNVWWERRANLAYLLVCRWLCIPVQRVHDSCLSWILWEVILNQNSDLSKLNYSREKKHKEFYQSNSQYFQGFFCPSGLVFVPLQFWFWYVKNIEVASEFSRAYPGPCGVREGGQTWAWLQQSLGTGTQPEAPEWTPTRSRTPFWESSFFLTVCPRGGSCTPAAGLGNRLVPPAWAEHCPGSDCPAAPAQPLHPWAKPERNLLQDLRERCLKGIHFWIYGTRCFSSL